MMIPELLQKQVEGLVEAKLTAVTSVGGGSINKAAKIETQDRNTFFLKWNVSAPGDMFPKEKSGLELLASADCGLRIPDVISLGTTNNGIDFLLIDFIESGSSNGNASAAFGGALAEQHKITDKKYGLRYDNYIGRLPQSNTRNESWIDFFIEERLELQLRQAIGEGKLPGGITRNFQQLYKKLPELLPEEPASLLHGDLWGGNYFYDKNGTPVIFDPAVYYGNREIELAFTHLFGGFSSSFYEAYRQAFPIEPGFKQRKDIYNLYPLLVHANMFGGHYGRQVESIVGRF